MMREPELHLEFNTLVSLCSTGAEYSVHREAMKYFNINPEEYAKKRHERTHISSKVYTVINCCINTSRPNELIYHIMAGDETEFVIASSGIQLIPH